MAAMNFENYRSKVSYFISLSTFKLDAGLRRFFRPQRLIFENYYHYYNHQQTNGCGSSTNQ